MCFCCSLRRRGFSHRPCDSEPTGGAFPPTTTFREEEEDEDDPCVKVDFGDGPRTFRRSFFMKF